jgi:hypothetical protein
MEIGPDNNYKGAIKNASFNVEKASYNSSVDITGWVYGEYDENANSPVPGDVPKDYGSFYDAKTDTVLRGNVEDHTTYNYRGNSFTSSDTNIATGAAYNSNEPPTSAGVYTVERTVSPDNNYRENTSTAEFTVARADPLPSVSLQGWVEGAEPNAPQVSGLPIGSDAHISYFYSGTSANGLPYGSENPPQVAGNYTVEATCAQTGNYNQASARYDFEITAAPPEPEPAPAPIDTDDNSTPDSNSDDGNSANDDDSIDRGGGVNDDRAGLVGNSNTGHWSIINLLLTFAIVFITALSIATLMGRKKTEHSCFAVRYRPLVVAANAVVGLAAVIVMFATQDLLAAMSVADPLTPLFFVLALVAVVLRLMPTKDEEEDGHTQDGGAVYL